MSAKGQAVDRYRWQQAICSELGPANPVARLVLLTISLHMDADGTNAWPSQATLAKRALVSRRSVITHLEIAERLGWVRRYIAGRNRQGWRLSGYEATVPNAVYETMPERPWEADPTWRRGERAAPRTTAELPESSPTTQGRGATDARDVVQLTTERGATGAKGGAPGAHDSSLLNLPSEVSLRGKVRLHAPRVKRFSEEQGKAEDPETRRAKILALAHEKPGDVAKILNAPVEEVLRVRALETLRKAGRGG